MAFGAAKRAHHRAVEEERARTRERDIREQAERDRQAQARMLADLQAQAAESQRAMLEQISKSMKQPVEVGQDPATPIMGTRTKKTKEKTQVRDLRIAKNPTLNLGGYGQGTNLG